MRIPYPPARHLFAARLGSPAVIGLAALLLALGSCRGRAGRASGCAADNDAEAGAAECRAAAPRYRWDGVSCESTVPANPLLGPASERPVSYLNQAVVFVRPRTTLAQLEAAAASVRGRVLSFMYDLDMALIEVPTNSDKELWATLDRLEKNACVASAMPNLLGSHQHGDRPCQARPNVDAGPGTGKWSPR